MTVGAIVTARLEETAAETKLQILSNLERSFADITNHKADSKSMLTPTNLSIIGGALGDKDPQQLISEGVIEGLLIKTSNGELPAGVRTGPDEVH